MSRKGLTGEEIAEYLKTGEYTVILDNDEFFIGLADEGAEDEWIYGGHPEELIHLLVDLLSDGQAEVRWV